MVTRVISELKSLSRLKILPENGPRLATRYAKQPNRGKCDLTWLRVWDSG